MRFRGAPGARAMIAACPARTAVCRRRRPGRTGGRCSRQDWGRCRRWPSRRAAYGSRTTHRGFRCCLRARPSTARRSCSAWCAAAPSWPATHAGWQARGTSLVARLAGLHARQVTVLGAELRRLGVPQNLVDQAAAARPGPTTSPSRPRPAGPPLGLPDLGPHHAAGPEPGRPGRRRAGRHRHLEPTGRPVADPGGRRGAPAGRCPARPARGRRCPARRTAPGRRAHLAVARPGLLVPRQHPGGGLRHAGRRGPVPHRSAGGTRAHHPGHAPGPRSRPRRYWPERRPGPRRSATRSPSR